MTSATRLYYRLKPWIPQGVRHFLRRKRALRRRAESASEWPILASAATRPKSWPGWPDGKQFAFVLTHDVEGPVGLSQIKNTMQLESEFGFHGSFNLIPEGFYRSTETDRKAITDRGGEVGVHDLHHDGTLFRSRRDFEKAAPRIRQYLKDWGAVGFRAGFMLHNYDWIAELGLEYDLTSFDTDPFEPQPDGLGTIFPSWMKRTNRVPFLELPYTMVQDHTAFDLLEGSDCSIWTQKLDWIARHGGMALMALHPDYISFDGRPTGSWSYPAARLRELFAYINERHGGKFWHALPRDVASYARRALPIPDVDAKPSP